eukprot:48592-Eustigmatos_ZCMA.PRE.1
MRSVDSGSRHWYRTRSMQEAPQPPTDAWSQSPEGGVQRSSVKEPLPSVRLHTNEARRRVITHAP